MAIDIRLSKTPRALRLSAGAGDFVRAEINRRRSRAGRRCNLLEVLNDE